MAQELMKDQDLLGIDTLAPAEVRSLAESMRYYWTQFGRIAAIPRSTFQQDAIIADTKKFALEIEPPNGGMEIYTDMVGNIFVEIQATPGQEGLDGTILQAHQDIVALPEPGKPGSPAENGVVPEWIRLNEKDEDNQETGEQW